MQTAHPVFGLRFPGLLLMPVSAPRHQREEVRGSVSLESVCSSAGGRQPTISDSPAISSRISISASASLELSLDSTALDSSNRRRKYSRTKRASSSADFTTRKEECILRMNWMASRYVSTKHSREQYLAPRKNRLRQTTKTSPHHTHSHFTRPPSGSDSPSR